MTSPNPWLPEADPLNLAVLGKAAEEAGELGAILARCIIQGIDESEPVTGKPNRQALEDEIADVMATAHLVVARFDLNLDRISARGSRKISYLGKRFAQFGGKS